jgi:hypothetical protein
MATHNMSQSHQQYDLLLWAASSVCEDIQNNPNSASNAWLHDRDSSCKKDNKCSCYLIYQLVLALLPWIFPY